MVFVQSADNQSDILTKNLSELHELHLKKLWLKSFEMFLAPKIFEVKRKGASDGILTSNILFENILMTRVSLT